MASFYGSNHTNAYQTVPSVNAPVGDFGGRNRVLYDKYVLSAAFANNDVINLGKLPKGAKILNATLVCPDMGGTGTFDFGYLSSNTTDEATSLNAWGNDIDWSGQAVAQSILSTIGYSTVIGKELAAEVTVQVLCNGATATTSGTIHSIIEYVLD